MFSEIHFEGTINKLNLSTDNCSYLSQGGERAFRSLLIISTKQTIQ